MTNSVAGGPVLKRDRTEMILYFSRPSENGPRALSGRRITVKDKPLLQAHSLSTLTEWCYYGREVVSEWPG